MQFSGFNKFKSSASADQSQEQSSEAPKRRGDNDPMVRLVPWLISILIHACLVAVALFVVWTTVIHTTSDSVTPTISASSTSSQLPLQMPVSKISSPATKSPAPAPNRTIHPTPVVPVTVDPIIGPSSSPVVSRSSPFDSNGSGSSGRAVILNSRGSGHRIAFVIDASGSLIDSLPFVLNELQSSIRKLHSPSPTDQGQSYTVIFFRGKNVFTASPILQAPPRGMSPASARNKQITARWLSSNEIQAGGQTDPLPAIKLAMGYHPDLIFLLSDNITGTGQYELNQQKLVDQIKQVVDHKAKINTIQFLSPDPLDNLHGRVGTMKLIAQTTGGTYTFFSLKHLDIQ